MDSEEDVPTKWLVDTLRNLAREKEITRLATIAECAKIADDHTPAKHEGTLAAHVTGSVISRAIRALSDTSTDCEGK
jgi:hypothetical protein